MKYRIIAFTILISALLSCQREVEPVKWVDLRYDVPQDVFEFDAAGKNSFTIRVKSTHPWTVSGTEGEDWYTVSPDSGGPDEIFTVTISCEENTDLDDRSDTLSIRSDYWTGRQFVITQKGTAYLDCSEPQMIPQDGTPVSLEVRSNQDWTAAVTSGKEWLGISLGGDNSLVLKASENSGEQRTAEVTLYDRNGDVASLVCVLQEGVLLSPSMPENGRWHILYSEGGQLRIRVESNARWTAVKKSPEEETWYDFASDTSFDGSGELVIDVSEYASGGSPSVRTGTVVVSSVTEEGGLPVIKTIFFKQASPDENRTRVYEGQLLDNKGLTSADGLPVGKYTFYLAPFSASDRIYLYFYWQKEGKSFAELRFWLNTAFATMQTELSCMPYCSDVNKWQKNLRVPFDSSSQVKISLYIDESEPDSSGNTWIYSQWWLNDVMIAQATSDGLVDKDGNTDTWKVPFADISAGGYFRIWAFSGSAELEKWEYTSHIDWEE